MKPILLTLEDFAVDTFALEAEDTQTQAVYVAAKTIGCRPTEYFCATTEETCPVILY